MSRFFRVRNFEKFQHYHDRRPPWIKLYRDLWSDPRFFDLSEADRYCLVALFVLASQHENNVPTSQKWLKTQLLMTRAIPLQRLIDTGWLEYVEQDASSVIAASNGLAESYPSRAGGERETEVQKYRSTEAEGISASGPPAIRTFGEFHSVKLSPPEHEKLKAKLGSSLQGYIDRLDRYSQSKPKKFREYQSHYAVILNWFDMDGKPTHTRGGSNGKTRSEQQNEAVREFLSGRPSAVGGSDEFPERRDPHG